MAQSNIEQAPLMTQASGNLITPVGQEIIFVIENDDAVANEVKVKFGVELHIGETSLNLSTNDDLIAKFKASPNNAGRGMFDFSSIIENYVKSDNIAAILSKYKGSPQTNSSEMYPLHLIDYFSASRYAVRYFGCQFYMEWLNTTTNVVERAAYTSRNSDQYKLINGYVKYSDPLTIEANDFGYDMDSFIPTGFSSNKRFLTNAPTTLYANDGDYGTLAFLTPDSDSADNTRQYIITYYNSAGAGISSPDTIIRGSFFGGYTNWSADASKQLLYIGCFPGNLKNWSSNYATALTAGLAYYTIQVKSTGGTQGLQTITINVNCPDLKNYESIRLCWLNQWGAWDYFTFTKKSVRKTSTQGTTYTQLGGSWNEQQYKVLSYKGGKKSFRVNATEKITMNSDFISEDHNVMFEELTNSPEVYMLESYQTDITGSAINNYVTPVKLTNSSFTKKTRANDNLIQYTFEVESGKTLRTQSV